MYCALRSYNKTLPSHHVCSGLYLQRDQRGPTKQEIKKKKVTKSKRISRITREHVLHRKKNSHPRCGDCENVGRLRRRTCGRRVAAFLFFFFVSFIYFLRDARPSYYAEQDAARKSCALHGPCNVHSPLCVCVCVEACTRLNIFSLRAHARY